MTLLGIKGHQSRGREVIELLLQLGNITDPMYDSWKDLDIYSDSDMVHVLDPKKRKIITYYYNDIPYNFSLLGEINIYDLEQFERIFPYKIGDNVALKHPYTTGKITDMRWDEEGGFVIYKYSGDHSQRWYKYTAFAIIIDNIKEKDNLTEDEKLAQIFLDGVIVAKDNLLGSAKSWMRKNFKTYCKNISQLDEDKFINDFINYLTESI